MQSADGVSSPRRSAEKEAEQEQRLDNSSRASTQHGLPCPALLGTVWSWASLSSSLARTLLVHGLLSQF